MCLPDSLIDQSRFVREEAGWDFIVGSLSLNPSPDESEGDGEMRGPERGLPQVCLPVSLAALGQPGALRRADLPSPQFQVLRCGWWTWLRGSNLFWVGTSTHYRKMYSEYAEDQSRREMDRLMTMTNT